MSLQIHTVSPAVPAKNPHSLLHVLSVVLVRPKRTARKEKGTAVHIGGFRAVHGKGKRFLQNLSVLTPPWTNIFPLPYARRNTSWSGQTGKGFLLTLQKRHFLVRCATCAFIT